MTPKANFLRYPKAGLATLAFTAGLTAALEATALVALVPLATTISSGKDAFQGRFLGHSVDLSVSALLAIAVTLAVGRALAQVLNGYVAARIPARYEARRRRELFSAFIDADWNLQSKEVGGHLQDTVTTSLQRSVMGLTALCEGVVEVFSLAIMMVVALLLNPTVSLIIVATMVALFFLTRPLSGRTRRHSLEQRSINQAYAHRVSEAVGMARDIKVFNAARPVEGEMQVLVDRSSRNRFRQLFLLQLVRACYQNVALILIVAGLAAIWWLNVDKVTALAPIVLLLVRALSYSQGLQNTYHRLNESRPFLEMLEQRIENLRAAKDTSGGITLDRIDSLSFSQVSFSYIPGKTVLREVSFETKRGEAIGVVGPSGAGKSTFVQLLLRLRRPDSGEVRVNGEPAQRFSLESWFARIGFVPQEPALLNTSVAENIRFYRPNVTQEAITGAARLAHIHEEILTWPEGYETIVGERGAEVSGGQRQRLCIARALLLEPDVLIFDEPTSALDAHSESLVQGTLEELRGRVTLFIVAHRLSTLNICDRIMVFSDGVLQAFASRHEVAQENRYYSDALRLSRLM